MAIRAVLGASAVELMAMGSKQLAQFTGYAVRQHAGSGAHLHVLAASTVVTGFGGGSYCTMEPLHWVDQSTRTVAGASINIASPYKHCASARGDLTDGGSITVVDDQDVTGAAVVGGGRYRSILWMRLQSRARISISHRVR